jgi:hypothetical protein
MLLWTLLTLVALVPLIRWLVRRERQQFWSSRGVKQPDSCNTIFGNHPFSCVEVVIAKATYLGDECVRLHNQFRDCRVTQCNLILHVLSPVN